MATNHVRNGRHSTFKETKRAILRQSARVYSEQQLEAAEKVCRICPDSQQVRTSAATRLR